HLKFRRRDGAERAIEVTTLRLGFPSEGAVAIVGRDVTEQSEAEALLLRHDRMAAMGTLATGVAHEINNPMTYVLGNVEFVARKLRASAASNEPPDTAALVDSLAHAIDGVHRVRQIVRDLLMFSQGNVEQRTLVDARAVLESSIQMAWHEIRHRARLTKHLSEVPPVG